SVLGESLRNAIRHAKPSGIDIHVSMSDETFSLEILNDGVNGRSSGTGMGLRLASLEALQIGGVGVRLRRRGTLAHTPGGAAVSKSRFSVLVVDDHEVVQWGFRLLLGQQPWVERCLTARNSREALELTRRYEPEVALVDLFLGDESGTELCETIRRESPRTRVLLISGAGRMSQAIARSAGASGFVSKDWDADDVAKAVRMVGMG